MGDHLKDLSEDEVKAYVQDNAFAASVAMINMSGDFNFSSVVRNANAFGFSRVYHVSDSKKWDRRGAVGTHHYTEVIHCRSLTDLIMTVDDDYWWVALENNVSFKVSSLYNFIWPRKTLLVVGAEGEGLNSTLLSACEHIVSIPQYGSVRSINAATAAGIAMNSYASQHYKGK